MIITSEDQLSCNAGFYLMPRVAVKPCKGPRIQIFGSRAPGLNLGLGLQVLKTIQIMARI